jgi:hypothetical protein
MMNMGTPHIKTRFPTEAVLTAQAGRRSMKKITYPMKAAMLLS